MEADFSGWATKAGLKCSDGRTIMPDAFKHQDEMTVPLVWQHGHTDPENVLGHVLLKNKKEGVYCQAFFNATSKAKHAKELVQHGDIKQLSIWANDLVERAKSVFHGKIREVSLVLSGANPGALIEPVTIRHSDGDLDTLDDEFIIYTGLEIMHADDDSDDDVGDGGETVQDVYDSMSEKQKKVLHYMVGEALASSGASGGSVEQSDLHHIDGVDGDETIQDIYDSMNEEQQKVLHYMVGEALESADNAEHSNLDEDTDDQKGKSMKHNVFENQEQGEKKGSVLSHDDMKEIVETAQRTGSLKHAVEEYALSHGITDIETLFPDAKAISNVPEWISRRVEWVGDFLGAVRKSPFSNIKTLSADLTFEDARAKGYVKGTLKREEFFGVASRSTSPTTIYKKQALDRDDVVDITDFDVVAWLKGEMRLMLDEELARAALIGDGRDVAHEDKINEGHIRPIATDHELYVTQVYVNVEDANSSMNEVIDAVIKNRYKLKGTGNPTFYTTEVWIGRFMTHRDADGHRMYKTLADLSAELRVKDVVAVEVMQDEEDIVGIIVNPVDYVMGATKGGEVNMFDDFDIDYNKQKYLIETRVSGALVKVKSAMVLRATAANSVLASPTAPTFDAATGELTITNTTGVVYKNAAGTTINAAGSPYTIDPGESDTVTATPSAGYHFASSDDDSWTFTADA